MNQKKQKPTGKPKKKVAAERVVAASPAKERKAEFELIHFDTKVWIFIGACTFLFFLFVSLKWHNSSIPHWSQVVPDGGDPNRGLVAGEPLFIRSDEWLVYTSFILSQGRLGFPVSNEAWGAGKSPLTFGLPTKNLVSVIKPSFWGYYFLDLERGFSWHWNFRIWPFLIASFLLLMLFTGNNFLISVFGSLWLFLSSAIQWWSMNTEIFTFGSIAVISFIYILYSEKPRTILINGILFLIFSFSFVTVLYPAYQVPMAYFLLALIVGYLIKNKNTTKLKYKINLPWKLMALGGSLLLLIVLILMFYQETKDTIHLMSDTVYPGKRDERGGDFVFLKLFADNFGMFMDINKYPANWGNICEASAFLMLAPFTSIIILIDFIKTKKADPLLISLLIFQFAMLVWMLIGLPGILAKITLLNTSPTYRTFFIFGFANVITTIVFMAHHKNSILKNTLVTKIISFVIIAGLVFSINYFLNKQANTFFTMPQVYKSTIILTGLIWLMLFFNFNKIFKISFFALGLLIILPNIKINPLSVGLSPYYDNVVYKTVTEVEKSDPGQGWILFGKFTYGNFLKAAGVKCFNGNQCVPPFDKLKILDPEMKSDSIYNRYAHIDVLPFIDADSVKFSLVQNDRYTIKMDPCSPRIVQMGIKYIAFTYQPQPIEVECMTEVKEAPGLFIYKRNDL
ncbi:MAG: hypothetical protein ABJC12_00090 [Saprospiraceae bacterium]